MRPTGVSVALIPLAVLIVGIALFSDPSTTFAVTHNPTTVNMTCDDKADGPADWWDQSCADNLTPGAVTTTTTHYEMTDPDSNFSFLAFGSPVDAQFAPGGGIPLGAEVGEIQNKINLGLINGPCATELDAPFTFFNAEISPFNNAKAQPEGTPKRLGNLMQTDTVDDDGDGMYAEDGAAGEETPGNGLFNYYDGENVDDDGDTLVDEDPPNNLGGIPVHARFYPNFLTKIFDPDQNGSLSDPAANGPIPPTTPYARYSAMASVAGEPISLQFMQFAPGQLTDYPATHPFTELGESFGWVNMIFLQTPSAVAISSPTTISAFCADLATHTLLHGQASEHGDSVFDDTTRYKNPPAGTGLVDPATGAGTNTHLNMTISFSYRDLDGDGVVNGDTYDTCARVDNTAWDPTAARPQLYLDLDGDTTPETGDSDQDGIPEVDTNANTVIDVDDGCDNIQTIGLGKADHEGHPETEIGGACANALDDDKDGRVNDGCVADGDPEVNQCQNNTDDDTGDGDGLVNDGCPIVIATTVSPFGAEVDQCSGAGNGVDNDNDGTVDDGCGGGDPPAAGAPETDQCQNAKDDDTDSRVNDGCPQSGGNAEVDECDNALNDDGDGTVNDGCFIDPLLFQNLGDGFTSGDDNCPVIFNPLQVESELDQTYTAATAGAGGPKTDGMGDECDTSPNLAEGAYRAKVTINAKCIGGTDTDGDGYCDATETALGSIASGGGAAASTPEHHAVHPPFPTTRAGAEVWGTATDGVATACTDGIDNDGDTNTDGADSGCGSANDGDEDGLDDVGGSYTDNCPGDDTELVTHPVNVAAYNPTQKDSDKDGIGDACDPDLDGDGWLTSREKWMGTDFNNVCPNTSSHDPWHVDQNRDKKVDVVDTLGLKGWKNAIANEADMSDPVWYSPRLDLIMDDPTDPSVPGDGIGGPTKRADIDSTDWLGIGGFKDMNNKTCGNGSVSIDSDGDTTPELVVGEDFYAGTPAGGASSFFDRTYSLNPDWRVQVTGSKADLSTISYKVTCPGADEHTFDIKWTSGSPPNELDTGGTHTVDCNDSSKVTVTILATHADVFDGP